tara:strand:- start:282 stop:1514 length:1233 start_codon:yes stop_codon:yes gene_type:complete
MNDKFYNLTGNLLFSLLSLSLFLGLFLNEDASGIGTSNDFKNTWEYVELLSNGYFIDSSQWTRLLPFHYIFLSILNEITDSIFLVRFLFCLLSLSIPILFYLNLKIKYPTIIKGKLIILSSIIIMLPFFRSSAIWPNPHLLSIIFLLISIYFFQKWKIESKKIIDINLILHVIFLAFAVYTRRYYVFLFLYYFLYYFQNLNLKNFHIITFFIFLLSLPGFILIFNFPFYLQSSGFSLKFYNTILIIPSIFLLYILPFLKLDFFNLNNKGSKLILIFSLFLVIFLSLFFDYNPKLGGGYFMKISNIFLKENYFFYITSLIGIYVLTKISLIKKENIFLIILIFLTFSNNYMFQKYFEPLWFIILFLILDLNFLKTCLKSKFQIIIVFIFFTAYSSTALLNSVYKISLNFFW